MTILCLNIGADTAFTSSISGAYFPTFSAWHLAPKIKYWEALGPAPQDIYFLTKSVASTVLGLDLWTKPTAYSTTLWFTGTLRIKSWKNKISDWAYSWVPVLGPSLGAVAAGLLYVYFS